jgi:hypothetical protein
VSTESWLPVAVSRYVFRTNGWSIEVLSYVRYCVCLSLIAIFRFLININSKICSAYRWLRIDKPEPVDFFYL